MALENETSNQEPNNEEHSDGESIMERQELMQESRMDIEQVNSAELTDVGINEIEESRDCESWQPDSSEDDDSFGSCSSENNTDPLEGPSGIMHRPLIPNDRTNRNWSQIEKYGPQIIENGTENESTQENAARLERYGNYLERYGPQLERYGSQLERFGSQLERIGPQLERCGNNLERYGPQLEALGLQLVRTGSQVEVNPIEDRCRTPQNGMSLQTQTESGNEGYAPQSADSCQGTPGISSPGSSRQGHWLSSPNSRRLSRRPSFQVNDGLVRHWIRRRNMDRDLMPFSRFREERRRSLWRNDGDLRDFRRLRASWRYQDNLFNRQHHHDNSRDLDNDHVRQHQDQQENEFIQQDHVRLPRTQPLHQDDPEYGFVILDEQNSPGPSRPDTSHSARRPRSHMSLRPLNVFNPPMLGPIAEYNAESDEENNDPRQDVFGRRISRAREGGVIRSWVMMNSYFHTRPLFIGQGDSKAIDGPFTLQRINQDDHFNLGNERNLDIARIPRPIPRNHRTERRQQRQQLAFQSIS